MITRFTYFKHDSNNDLQIWIAEYDDSLKLTISSNEEEDQEKTYEDKDILQKDIEDLIRQAEKKGFKLGAKQTFIDPENPTVDELESQILLRYKLMGVTDTVLLKNARVQAMKMLKNDSGNHEEYDLETMEFTVDLENHDSLKNLLNWQIENFDELLQGVQENMNISYGKLDADEGFITYEDDEYESYNSEGLFYKAAAKYEDLRPLIAEFIDLIMQKNDDRAIFRDEETPYGAWAAFELAMSDRNYIRNYIDYVNSLEENGRYYYDRFNPNHSMHIPKLIERYGFDKNDDLVLEFIAAQMVHRDNQHFAEEVAFMTEIGLDEAMEDREFAEKLFVAMIQRGEYLSDYYNNSSITNWVARDLAVSFRIIGIKASQAAVLEILEALEEDNANYPSLSDFEEEMEDRDEDDDEGDDEEEEDDSDEEDENVKKFASTDYKKASKILATLDYNAIKDLILTGIPLNKEKFTGAYGSETALECLSNAAFSGGSNTDKDYSKKIDSLFMLLIAAGAEVNLKNIDFVASLYVFNCSNTLDYVFSKGFDINKSQDHHGATLLQRYIYIPKMVDILLANGADPLLNETILHDALQYLPLTTVRRLVEEYKVPLMTTDHEGRTPVEAIVYYCKQFVEPRIEQYKQESEDPKLKDKRDNSGETPAEKLANAKRMLENRDYIMEYCKNMPPLYSPATNQEEQELLDMRLIEACKEQEIKLVTIDRLLKVKANPNAKDKDGMTPLHFIAKQHYPHLIVKGLDLLRGAGVNADNMDNYGRTPLFYFCTGYHGNKEALLDLVNYGIDPAHKDNNGYNALGYMISVTDPNETYNSEQTIVSMLAVGIPPIDIDPDGGTLYHHLGIFDGFEVEEIMETLKEKGIDINAKNKNGDTALHLAVKDTSERDFTDSYVERLAEAGADVNIQDAEGNTALSLSVYPEDDYKVLLEQGADLHIKNKAGKTVLEVITEKGFYSDKFPKVKKMIEKML